MLFSTRAAATAWMSRSRSSTSVSPLQLDLTTVLRLEEHAVGQLHGADVGTDADDLGPDQPLADLRGRRDHDAAGRTTLAVGAVLLDQDAVVEQLDRQRVSVGHQPRWKILRRTTSAVSVPGDDGDRLRLGGAVFLDEDLLDAAEGVLGQRLGREPVRELVDLVGEPLLGSVDVGLDLSGLGRAASSTGGGVRGRWLGVGSLGPPYRRRAPWSRYGHRSPGP